jgi:hypothetical protein
MQWLYVYFILHLGLVVTVARRIPCQPEVSGHKFNLEVLANLSETTATFRGVPQSTGYSMDLGICHDNLPLWSPGYCQQTANPCTGDPIFARGFGSSSYCFCLPGLDNIFWGLAGICLCRVNCFRPVVVADGMDYGLFGIYLGVHFSSCGIPPWQGGTPSFRFVFLCDPTASSPVYLGSNEVSTCQYRLRWRTVHGCAVPSTMTSSSSASITASSTAGSTPGASSGSLTASSTAGSTPGASSGSITASSTAGSTPAFINHARADNAFSTAGTALLGTLGGIGVLGLLVWLLVARRSQCNATPKPSQQSSRADDDLFTASEEGDSQLPTSSSGAGAVAPARLEDEYEPGMSFPA